MEDDVVSLPLAGRPRGVDQRRRLAVEAAEGSVGIGRVVERVEDLDLVAPLQIDAAVAAHLPVLIRH